MKGVHWITLNWTQTAIEAVRTPLSFNLHCRMLKKKKLHLFSIRLQLLGSVAHSMQCMWGTLWYFVHKQNKQNYWGHDDIRVPWHIACSGLCGRPHWTQEEEICACCMQITLKSSIQIRYCVVEVRLFMRQKRSNRWTYIQVFADFHTKKKSQIILLFGLLSIAL